MEEKSSECRGTDQEGKVGITHTFSITISRRLEKEEAGPIERKIRHSV